MRGKHFSGANKQVNSVISRKAVANTGKRKLRMKDLLISFIAVVEILMILITATYSWVETISTIIITGDGLIDTYTFTEAEIGTSNAASIDLSKYFREAGKAHLSAASSADGEHFYFPIAAKTGAVTDTYRAGNVNDKNVNYIEYSFIIKTSSETKFYFDKVPEIKIGGTKITDNSVCFSITVGNATTIYSNESTMSSYVTVVSSTDGNTSRSQVRPFSTFVYDSAKTTNTELFKINGSQEVKIRMWLQGGSVTNNDIIKAYSGKDIVVNDFKLVTANSGVSEINFIDRTTAFNSSVNGYNWVENNNNVVFAYNLSRNEKVEMTKSKADPTHWTADVFSEWFTQNDSAPIRFYVCKSGTTVDTLNVNNADTYLVRWETTAKEARNNYANNGNTYRYTAYGNVHSNDKQLGFGTWGTVVGIELGTEDQDALSTPARDIDAAKVLLIDPSNSSVSIEMNYGKVSENGKYWRGYIPLGNNNLPKVQFNITAKDGSGNDETFTIDADKRYAYDEENTVASSRYIITYRDRDAKTHTGYWEPPATYNVHIVCNDTKNTGGTVEVSGGRPGSTTVKVTGGTSVTIKATENLEAFIDEHYQFDGWFSDAQCENRLTNKNTKEYTVSPALGKDQTGDYYAKFVKVYRVAVYAVNGAQIADDTTAGVVQMNYGNRAVQSSGYREQFAVYVNYGTTLAANSYNIKLNSKRNDTGYTFEGWFDSISGGNRLFTGKGLGDEVDLSTEAAYKTINKDLNFYARFLPKSFTVQIEVTSKSSNGSHTGASTGSLDGGTITIVEPNGDTTTLTDTGIKVINPFYYKNTVKLTAIPKTDNGYEFVGWYVSNKNAIPQYDSVAPVSTELEYSYKLVDEENKYIFAYFKLREYDITASVSDGNNTNPAVGTIRTSDNTLFTNDTNPSITKSVQYGTSITFNAYIATGYTFVGWYDKVDPTNDDVALGTETSYTIIANDKCLKHIYAVFKPNASTTTIYFEKRNYQKMCAYAYNSKNTGTLYLGKWVDNECGGTALDEDTNDTGLMKTTFKTSDTGKFRIIVNDSGKVTAGSQYPATTNEGLEGDIGGTYYFGAGEPSGLVKIDDSTIYDVTFVAKAYSGSTVQSGFDGNSIKVHSVTSNSNVTYKYYKYQPIIAEAIASNGYTFDKWYSDANCANQVSSTSELNKTAIGSNRTIEYYAKFTKAGSVRVYFTVSKSYNWSGTIYCYAWNYADDKNAAWPGVAMTYESTNYLDEKIYYIDIPDKYTSLKFNNNDDETVEITKFTNNSGYYVNGGDYKSRSCGTYTYQ